MTPPAGSDPTSLDRLHDIVLPAAVPFWPPAPGWIVLAAAIALLGAGLATWILRRRRRNRYRVEALAELERLRSGASGIASAELAGDLLVLLRRTALSAYPRRELASLSGSDWWRYLDERDREPRFSQGRGARLEALAYAAIAPPGSPLASAPPAQAVSPDHPAAPATEETLQDLVGAVEAWIRGHRGEAAAARAGAEAR